MNYLILLRHGQSQWNLENKFTGMTDISLTKKGIQEASEAGKLIDNLSINIDQIFSSVLKRAYDTAQIAMNNTRMKSQYESGEIKIIKNKALNERDYGKLVGLNKAETIKKYGNEQVHIWRRSYDTHPPSGESLKDVINRVDPYYKKNIEIILKKEKNILVVAHGNSLRAMFISLKLYSPEEISDIEIPTGKPFVVEFKKNNLIKSYYLS